LLILLKKGLLTLMDTLLLSLRLGRTSGYLIST
jgi:hypothetical protein